MGGAVGYALFLAVATLRVAQSVATPGGGLQLDGARCASAGVELLRAENEERDSQNRWPRFGGRGCYFGVPEDTGARWARRGRMGGAMGYALFLAVAALRAAGLVAQARSASGE